MAINTSVSYRNQVLYSVFVRNHTKEGTFAALEKDLARIRALGVDIIWLLPIHPIGQKGKKGSLGCPYAIRDYRAVNPEYGTKEQFVHLVDAIHANGMKCIIDVVYNHTSPDSVLAQQHPEWFYHKPDGSFGNRIGDWTDVIDLDYNSKELRSYQIETLCRWAQIVDGFRCDVAPLIPLDFWLEARAAVEKVHPGCFWLSETVEPTFTMANRARGMGSLSDAEIYQAFDASYEYDVFSLFKGYLMGQNTLAEYTRAVQLQEVQYPDNYVKLRFLENHDNARAAFMIPDEKCLLNWTAFCYFQKGMTLLYAGQERAMAHLPSLFDRDTLGWESGPALDGFLQKLSKVHHDPVLCRSSYTVTALPHDVIYAEHACGTQKRIGIFSMHGQAQVVPVCLPDGRYPNLLDDSTVEVHAGMLSTKGMPIVFALDEGQEKA